MTQYVYGVIHNEKGAWRELTIPDGADVDLQSAYGWFMADDDAVWMEQVTLNPDNYWVGYFFYNDMEGPEEAEPLYFNTQEHLDAHWESNNGGGHYDCTRYEHIVNGKGYAVVNHAYCDHYSEINE